MRKGICFTLVSLSVLWAAMSGQGFAQGAPKTVLPRDWHPSPAPGIVQQREPLAPVGDATTTCAKSYSSGTGDAATAYCVTVNGTIPQFSRAGQEMINSGQVGEGYGICDLNTATGYYDYSYADSGNWLTASFTSTATAATSTRLTSDGIWKIVNTITKTPASATTAGKATVKMTVTNLTGISRSAFVLRFADVDADADNLNNDFDFTINTVTGQYSKGSGESTGYGLELVNDTFSASFPTDNHNEYALSAFDGPDPCNAFSHIATQPFHGDGSEMAIYGGTWGPHKALTITVAYLPQ